MGYSYIFDDVRDSIPLPLARFRIFFQKVIARPPALRTPTPTRNPPKPTCGHHLRPAPHRSAPHRTAPRHTTPHRATPHRSTPRYIFACTFLCMFLCTFICTFLCMFLHTFYEHISTHNYTHICVQICTHNY